jgi:hypothetical protein
MFYQAETTSKRAIFFLRCFVDELLVAALFGFDSCLNPWFVSWVKEKD